MRNADEEDDGDILDQRDFSLSPHEFKAFLKALDTPPAQNPKPQNPLRKTPRRQV